jgi:hypothetical protein
MGASILGFGRVVANPSLTGIWLAARACKKLVWAKPSLSSEKCFASSFLELFSPSSLKTTDLALLSHLLCPIVFNPTHARLLRHATFKLARP